MPEELEWRRSDQDAMEIEFRVDGDDAQDSGGFGGYLNLHSRRDSYNTEFRSQAWAPYLQTAYTLRDMHSTASYVRDTLGMFTADEDERGLRVAKGSFARTQAGQDARALAHLADSYGQPAELSVGFLRKGSEADEKRGGDKNIITKAELREASLIIPHFASQKGAELTSVRAQADALRMVTDTEDLTDSAIEGRIIDMMTDTNGRARKLVWSMGWEPVEQRMEEKAKELPVEEAPADAPVESDEEPEDDAPEPPAKGSLEDKLIQVAAAVNAWAEENHEGAEVHVMGTFDDHVEVSVDGESEDVSYSVDEDGEVTLGEQDEPEDEESDTEELEDDQELEARGAISYEETDVEDGDWDADAEVKKLGDATEDQLRAMHAWVDPEGDPAAKASYKFPHHFVTEDGTVGAASSKACIAAIAALNGARNEPSISDADRQGVYAHVSKHLSKKDGFSPAPLNQTRDQRAKVRSYLVAELRRVADNDNRRTA